ncbi:MAG: DUF3299 domain-containing protein [Pseudomonadota bacterium]
MSLQHAAHRLCRPRFTAFNILIWLLLCASSASAEQTYREIEWIELIPEEVLEILMNPPETLMNIADGSELDKLPSEGGDSAVYGMGAEAQRYEEALQSTEVKAEFDGERVKIPGFIVPLAFDETRMISEFFLVPYFGACLHSPPPPPNQIIHSKFDGGISLDDIYEPFWLEGTLSVGMEATDIGTAAYKIAVDRVLRYDEG